MGSTYKASTLVNWLQEGNSLNETVRASRSAWDTDDFSACGIRLGSSPYNVRNDTGGTGPDITPLRATTVSGNTALIAMASELDLCDIADTDDSLSVSTAGGEPLSALPSDVLGSGGNTIAPLRMASAFGAIGAGGQACAPVAINTVTRPDGSSIAPPSADCRQATESDVVATAASALKTVLAPGGTGAASAPRDGVEILGKTSITDSSKDTWMVGSTSEVATAVWVGNVQGEVSMRGNTLVAGAADRARRHRVLRPFMSTLNARYGGDDFPPASTADSPPLRRP